MKYREFSILGNVTHAALKKHHIEVHHMKQSIFDCLFLCDLLKTELAREKSSLPHAARAGMLDFTLNVKC